MDFNLTEAATDRSWPSGVEPPHSKAERHACQDSVFTAQAKLLVTVCAKSGFNDNIAAKKSIKLD
jgi:hypothetical protein